jgi:hypothetical protein
MTARTNHQTSDNGRLAALRAEVAALPDMARSALFEQTLVDLPGQPTFCGLILSPTQFETDLRTIAGRASVTAQLLTAQSALNVGDTFQVKATLKNCTGFRLADAQLVASGTQFASVTSTGTVDLGALGNGNSASATFQCKATSQTPTLGGPADPLIKVFGRLVLDLTSATGTADVQGEIFPV